MRFILLTALIALCTAGCSASTSGESDTAPASSPPAAEPSAPATAPTTPAAEPSSPVAAPATAPRAAAVAAEHALYQRVEGTIAANACSSDSDCVVSGCSQEICAAEPLTSTCEVRDWPQGEGATCGCVDGSCVWYR
ncbi:eight-cysteine-cluster domain-containing protein [Haliangium sp.]|uniref:eight-cysteine-cluster domain-containing protein n=1 Tax=Haliangium sp. TaxID=2663208 RepID=UPI003D0FCC3C